MVLRALEQNPEDRWSSVEEMRRAFLLARDAQLASTSRRPVPAAATRTSDWSSQVMSLMDERSWRDAEAAARVEFQHSRDPHAFLLMVRAAVRDERYFDALHILDSAPEMVRDESSVTGDLELLALEALVRTERVNEAAAMVERCLARQGDAPGLLLRKASLFGLQARYREAAEILLDLNRRLPRRRAVLKRLVLVYEQLREMEQAEAFRKVLAKVEREAVC